MQLFGLVIILLNGVTWRLPLKCVCHSLFLEFLSVVLILVVCLTNKLYLVNCITFFFVIKDSSETQKLSSLSDGIKLEPSNLLWDLTLILTRSAESHGCSQKIRCLSSEKPLGSDTAFCHCGTQCSTSTKDLVCQSWGHFCRNIHWIRTLLQSITSICWATNF